VRDPALDRRHERGGVRAVRPELPAVEREDIFEHGRGQRTHGGGHDEPG
jgi:hypothetical protein